ncbi:hypothetical protein [Geomicrobium sp. JCM 19039]|uniref:hypothetical protein n=1 Tax=Geomicrobium sp. JCM 19039 TaxID=1460636 RepID=UPI00045F2449|nr:hypothetical protein [Geomicrobium sp. JCM 19039]GAK11365.1 hypothetical protein JCM19039_1055 [Geomicrobium sp. JCM 19039]
MHYTKRLLEQLAEVNAALVDQGAYIIMTTGDTKDKKIKVHVKPELFISLGIPYEVTPFSSTLEEMAYELVADRGDHVVVAIASREFYNKNISKEAVSI